jgi:hypothetical protein
VALPSASCRLDALYDGSSSRLVSRSYVASHFSSGGGGGGGVFAEGADVSIGSGSTEKLDTINGLTDVEIAGKDPRVGARLLRSGSSGAAAAAALAARGAQSATTVTFQVAATLLLPTTTSPAAAAAIAASLAAALNSTAAFAAAFPSLTGALRVTTNFALTRVASLGVVVGMAEGEGEAVSEVVPVGVMVVDTVGVAEGEVPGEGVPVGVVVGVGVPEGVRLGEGFMRKARPRGSRATPLPPPKAMAGASNPVASPLLRNREPVCGPLEWMPTALSPLRVLSTQDTKEEPTQEVLAPLLLLELPMVMA